MLGTKFSVKPNPLTKEKEEGTNGKAKALPGFYNGKALEFYKAQLSAITDEIKDLGINEGGGKKCALMAKANAIAVKIEEQETVDLEKKFNEEYIQEFRCWILGKSEYNKDRKKTPWGQRRLVGDSINAYLNQFIDAKSLYEVELTKLMLRPPNDIMQAWLYFKYIVVPDRWLNLDYEMDFNWWAVPGWKEGAYNNKQLNQPNPEAAKLTQTDPAARDNTAEGEPGEKCLYSMFAISTKLPYTDQMQLRVNREIVKAIEKNKTFLPGEVARETTNAEQDDTKMATTELTEDMMKTYTEFLDKRLEGMNNRDKEFFKQLTEALSSIGNRDEAVINALLKQVGAISLTLNTMNNNVVAIENGLVVANTENMLNINNNFKQLQKDMAKMTLDITNIKPKPEPTPTPFKNIKLDISDASMKKMAGIINMDLVNAITTNNKQITNIINQQSQNTATKMEQIGTSIVDKTQQHVKDTSMGLGLLTQAMLQEQINVQYESQFILAKETVKATTAKIEQTKEETTDEIERATQHLVEGQNVLLEGLKEQVSINRDDLYLLYEKLGTGIQAGLEYIVEVNKNPTQTNINYAITQLNNDARQINISNRTMNIQNINQFPGDVQAGMKTNLANNYNQYEQKHNNLLAITSGNYEQKLLEYNTLAQKKKDFSQQLLLEYNTNQQAHGLPGAMDQATVDQVINSNPASKQLNQQLSGAQTALNEAADSMRAIVNLQPNLNVSSNSNSPAIIQEKKNNSEELIDLHKRIMERIAPNVNEQGKALIQDVRNRIINLNDQYKNGQLSRQELDNNYNEIVAYAYEIEKKYKV